VVLTEGAQFGVSRDADHLECACLVAANGDFLANRVSLAEEALGKCSVENYGNRSPRSVGQSEISAAQDGNAKDAAELLAATEFVRLPCGGNRLVPAAYQILGL